MKKLIFIFLFLSSVVHGQNRRVDSIMNLIQKETNDSVKIDLYNKVAWFYIFNNQDKARMAIADVEEIASKKGQEFGYNSLLNVKGVFHDVNGRPDSAEFWFKKSLAYSREHGIQVHEEHTLNNLGMFCWNKGNYEDALAYYFESLKLVGGKKDKLSAADAGYNNIGLIYQDMELYKKAIPYHNKALSIRKELGNERGEATSFSNLGVCYTNLGHYDSAENALLTAKKIMSDGRDKNLYYEIVEGLGELYSVQQKYTKAQKYYLEAWTRPESVPFNPNRKVNVLEGLAECFAAIGQHNKAISYGEQAIQIIKSDTTIDFKEVDLYQTLAGSYFSVGDSKKGQIYNQKFYEASSNKFKQSTAKALQELETKYETQQKELALQKSQANNRQKNLIIYSSLGLAFLLGLIGFLVFKQQRLKNEQLVKENELKQALVKIEHQNKMQEQRLAISRELHDNIGSQLTFIISSLDGLKQFDIENNQVFDKIDNIGGFTRDTINDLRDTIWAMNKDEISFQDLKERTKHFIDRAKQSVDGINFRFNYPIEFEETSLNSKLGIDVYRIIQEAVHNAVKHAQASEIHVNFLKEDDTIRITIEDNGDGFDLSKVKQGSGLNSMQMRAEKIGAEFGISSQEHGTRVMLNVPT